MGLFGSESEYDSRYIKIIPYLNVKKTFQLSNDISISHFSENENENLIMKVRKRNVFARHSWENDFYITRLKSFSGKSIISIVGPGTPKDINFDAREISQFIENILIVSTIFSIKREDLHRKLSSVNYSEINYDFSYSQDLRYLKSKTLTKKSEFIVIDDYFIKKFEKIGFYNLFNSYFVKSEISSRIKKSLNWLYQSRNEQNLNAAIVKSSIALESLLIFSDSESLSKSLSERTAFILSSSPKERGKISKIVNEFYNARSAIVHGGKKKVKSISINIIESMDRLLTLTQLIICTNLNLWKSDNELKNWCEEQKWGEEYKNVNIPFSKNYLNNAIKVSKLFP